MEDNRDLDEIFGRDDDAEGGPTPVKRKRPELGKGIYVLLVVALLIALAGVFVIGFFVGKGSYSGFETEQPMIDEIYGILKEHYIEDITKDEFKAQYDQLMAAGYASTLDRYTGLLYRTPPVINGEYGITISVDNNSIKTVRTVLKAGAMNGKLMRGDIVIGVKLDNDNWVECEHMILETFRDMVKKSKKANFKVRRNGEEVTTGMVSKADPTSDPRAEYLDTPFSGIGYVRLDSFETGAAYDFLHAVHDFYESGNNIMMLDLRDNPGGTNIELSRIVRTFIAEPTGKDLVLSIKIRDTGNLETYADKYNYTYLKEDFSRGTFNNDYIGTKVKEKTGKDFHLIIMANDNSASATEAFIGNIIHYMDASDYLLLGEAPHTFGKGIAQQDFPLKSSKNKLILHVTVGKYYVLGAKGTLEETVLKTIHGEGYPLDNKDIEHTIMNDIFTEDIIVKGVARAQEKWGSNSSTDNLEMKEQ